MIQQTTVKFLLSVVLLVACSATSQAALNLLINPNTEQFALTGSDSGDFLPASGGGVVSWAALLGMPNNNSFFEYNTEAAFSVSAGEVGRGSESDIDTALSFASGIQGVILTLFFDTSPNTITGTGVYQSYAAFDPDDKAQLASMDGEELFLFQGSGFESVSAQVIPEPASFLPLALTVFVFAVSRKRRRLTHG